jgi:hypothetical protein
MVAGSALGEEWDENEKQVSENRRATCADLFFQKLVSCVWRKGHFSQENLFLFLKFISTSVKIFSQLFVTTSNRR